MVHVPKFVAACPVSFHFRAHQVWPSGASPRAPSGGHTRKLRPGGEQAKGRGRDGGGGGAVRGGEEKVALGSLESWEVAAAGFASLRACVRERAREQERSERAPAMPIRPRLAAPGRGARPDSLQPGPARPRPPALRAPRRVLPSPRPGGPSPPPGPAPRRSPALLSPSLPAAEQHGGARAAAARPPAAPLSPAQGQLGIQTRPPSPPRPPVHLSHCAPPGARRTPGTLCAPGPHHNPGTPCAAGS